MAGETSRHIESWESTGPCTTTHACFHRTSHEFCTRFAPWGPLTNMDRLSSRHGKVIPFIIWCLMKLRIHSITSTVKLLSLRMDKSLLGHFILLNYSSMLGSNLMHVSKRGPWCVLFWLCNVQFLLVSFTATLTDIGTIMWLLQCQWRNHGQ